MGLLGVGLEVVGNLGEGLGGQLLLQERSGLHSLLDDFLRSLNDVLSLVVLVLFGSPFLISGDLLGVQLGDLVVDQLLELVLVGQKSDLLVSNGDLLV